MFFRLPFAFLFLLGAVLSADVPFFWLEKPSQRSNPHDPAYRGPNGTANPPAPTATPMPTLTPIFYSVRSYGGGAAANALSRPVGVAINQSGQLVVADRGLKAFKVFDTMTGNAVGTYAMVTTASGSNVAGRITLDASDNLYACNAGFLQKYGPAFNLIWSVSATPASAGDPTPGFGDIALHPGGWVIVTDVSNSGQERFLRYDTNGVYQSRHTYKSSTLFGLESVEAHPGGQLMFFSTLDRRWAILNETGGLQSQFGEYPMDYYSRGALFLLDGRVIHAISSGLVVYSASGAFVAEMYNTFSPFGYWGNIMSVTLGSNGHMFVAEMDKGRVLELTP